MNIKIFLCQVTKRMVKKYDKMAAELKRFDKKRFKIIKYTEAGQLPVTPDEDANSLRMTLVKIKKDFKWNQNLNPIGYFIYSFRNAHHRNHLWDGGCDRVTVGPGKHIADALFGGAFVKTKATKDYAELHDVLDRAHNVAVKRWCKNPEQAYLKLIVNRGYEKMAYHTCAAIMRPDAFKADGLADGLNDLLASLLYAGCKHSLEFHAKWNKVSRHRCSDKEVKRFQQLLESDEFCKNLASVMHHIKFRVTNGTLKNAIRSYERYGVGKSMVSKVLNSPGWNYVPLEAAGANLLELFKTAFYPAEERYRYSNGMFLSIA
jgi:hypothetical protein